VGDEFFGLCPFKPLVEHSNRTHKRSYPQLEKNLPDGRFKFNFQGMAEIGNS
jgi:hypothetical protein